jgi:hypothetical protein
MWVKRALTVPYFLSSVVNPWLSICLLSPFRRRVLKLLRKIKILKPEADNVFHITTTRGRTPPIRKTPPIRIGPNPEHPSNPA